MLQAAGMGLPPMLLTTEEVKVILGGYEWKSAC
jgi:hypothetical protein